MGLAASNDYATLNIWLVQPALLISFKNVTTSSLFCVFNSKSANAVATLHLKSFCKQLSVISNMAELLIVNNIPYKIPLGYW